MIPDCIACGWNGTKKEKTDLSDFDGERRGKEALRVVIGLACSPKTGPANKGESG